jgi:PAS domain S-box-containing protein
MAKTGSAKSPRRSVDLSVRGKLLVGVLAPLLALGLGAAIWLTSTELRSLKSGRIQRVHGLIEALELDLARLQADTAGPQAPAEIARRLRLIPEVERFFFYGPGADIVFAYNRADLPPAQAPPMLAPEAEFIGPTLHLRRFVRSPEGALGRVYVRFTAEDIPRFVKSSLLRIGASAVGLIGLILWIGGLLHFSISNPIRSMAESMDRVTRASDFSLRVEERGADEVKRLGRGVNAMLECIESCQAQLDTAASRDAERARDLRRTLDRYENVIRVSLDGMIVVDAEGRFIDVNEAYVKKIGYSAEELSRLSLFDISTSAREEIVERVRHVSEGGCSRFEATHRARDGSLIDFEVSCGLLADPNGGIVAFMRDISERKQAETELNWRRNRLEELIEERTAALRQSEDRFRRLIEHAADAVIVHDANGRILDVNQQACRSLGYAREELIGANVRDIEVDFAAAKVAEQWKRLGAEEPVTIEGRHRRKDGETFPVEVRVTRIESSGEGLMLALVRDISQRKRAEAEKTKLEEQLRHAMKMEAIGALAGGVAHDFNNILTAILGYATLLEQRPDSRETVERAAGVITKAAERARQLTGQLLGFARKGKHRVRPVDIHQTVREVVSLLDCTMPKSIKIRIALEAASPDVLGDPDQLQQVILNLAVNARDAMENGGELSFGASLVEFSDEDCRSRPEYLPGRYLALSVQDTGAGIDPEIRDRIFEPFFTTKEPGKGTGMGLATVYGIVKNHGGSIEVYSELGRGTVFKVYLPHQPRRAAPKAPRAERRAVQGRGRILIVDDEAMVRAVASDMLQALGYEVLTANDGLEAVEIFKEAAIDLVLIDLMMPNMDGRECFRALKEFDPAVRAVLSTGFSRDGAAQDILDEGMLDFVQKPYRMNQLSEVVARVLQPRTDRSTSSPGFTGTDSTGRP